MCPNMRSHSFKLCTQPASDQYHQHQPITQGKWKYYIHYLSRVRCITKSYSIVSICCSNIYKLSFLHLWSHRCVFQYIFLIDWRSKQRAAVWRRSRAPPAPAYKYCIWMRYSARCKRYQQFIGCETRHHVHQHEFHLFVDVWSFDPINKKECRRWDSDFFFGFFFKRKILINCWMHSPAVSAVFGFQKYIFIVSDFPIFLLSNHGMSNGIKRKQWRNRRSVNCTDGRRQYHMCACLWASKFVYRLLHTKYIRNPLSTN